MGQNDKIFLEWLLHFIPETYNQKLFNILNHFEEFKPVLQFKKLAWEVCDYHYTITKTKNCQIGKKEFQFGMFSIYFLTNFFSNLTIFSNLTVFCLIVSINVV
jgi:hypothetical protein